MATVFRQAGRQVYDANVKLWDAAAGKWRWKKVCTGVRDEGRALAAATKLEDASTAAKAGTMNRKKAEQLVEMILSMAGIDMHLGCPTLQAFGEEFLAGRLPNVSPATKRKYEAHWTRLTKWAGDKMQWRIDRWDSPTLSEYYRDLRAEFSATTSNDHMRTLSMLFIRAGERGIIDGNPVATVERESNDSSDKIPISRGDIGKLLWHCRRKKLAHWFALSLLGWHTGHRIEDLLSVSDTDLEQRDDVGWVVKIQPDKKARQEGRLVILPIPPEVVKAVQAVKNFEALGSNRNGVVSNRFILLLQEAGVEVPKVQKKKREIALKSFHSFRHSMASRLVAAGVPGSLARLVTDHDSEQVHILVADIRGLNQRIRVDVVITHSHVGV